MAKPKKKGTDTAARHLEVVTMRAQDVLDRLTDVLDTEHKRMFLRRQWRNEPTPAERLYLARGLDRTGPELSSEFMLEGRRVSAEFAAGYKYGYEAGQMAEALRKPIRHVNAQTCEDVTANIARRIRARAEAKGVNASGERGLLPGAGSDGRPVQKEVFAPWKHTWALGFLRQWLFRV